VLGAGEERTLVAPGQVGGVERGNGGSAARALSRKHVSRAGVADAGPGVQGSRGCLVAVMA
jgi:hypothetical protein